MTVENRENFGDDPKFFVGVEVERTPLFGMNTLFVIDKQNPERNKRVFLLLNDLVLCLLIICKKYIFKA